MMRSFLGFLFSAIAMAQPVALVNARIYPAPGAAVIADGVVVIRGDRIDAVGAGVKPPAGARVIDCKGLVVMAGFQNSHVHFMEPKWNDAAKLPAETLQRHLAGFLTAYGFTTVVDTGSVLAVTKAVRARVESGDVPGPRILTAGSALFPANALPFYLASAPKELKDGFLQPATSADAVKVVRENLAGGADITKLFAGSMLSPQKIVPIPVDVAKAAATETHRQKKLVFAHPSNHEGIRVSIASGVDVLVHTTAGAGPWPPELIEEMKRSRVSVIPTLQLWGIEVTGQYQAAFVNDGVQQLKSWVAAGGDVLFGTDVGYTQAYDPAQEYELMSKAGMTVPQVLESLTVAPARKFGEERRRGTVARGMQADLVVLAGDPAGDVRNFARVRYTIRNGKLIFEAK